MKPEILTFLIQRDAWHVMSPTDPPSAAVRHTHTHTVRCTRTASSVSQVCAASRLASEGGGCTLAAVLRIISIGSDKDDLTKASC